MEDIYRSLSDRCLDTYAQLAERQPSLRRILIALAGPPGSGKSTIADEIIRCLNTGHDEPMAVVVPMDGFHHTRAYLDSLPNASMAYRRRGAHWTYDANCLLQMVKELYVSRTEASGVIKLPSFDHALKDPVDDAIHVASEARIVILEGNWLLFDQNPWREISQLMDDTWFVDVDPAVARERVAMRHVKSGIELTLNAALARADANDVLNGQEVREHLIEPNVRVESVQIKTCSTIIEP